MKSEKNNYITLILLKLLLISFLFSLPSFQNFELQSSAEFNKFSHLSAPAGLVISSSHSETKLLKRVPFLDNALFYKLPEIILISTIDAKTTPDYRLTKISHYIQSSLARAPPV